MQKPQVPFFVRFLEAQEALEIKTDVKAGKPPGGGGSGGGGHQTMKYPSDDDEGVPS